MSRQQTYNTDIILQGNAGVGKTSTLYKYTDYTFYENSFPNIGVDFRSKLIMHKDIKIQARIWDVAGSDRFIHITNNYYKRMHGIILLYDISNRSTFQYIQQFQMQQIQNNAKQYCQIVVIGNKSDLDFRREVSFEEGQKFAESIDSQFFEVSAKSGQNIDYAIDSLIHRIIKDKENIGLIKLNEVSSKKIQLQQIEQNNERSKCCIF